MANPDLGIAKTDPLFMGHKTGPWAGVDLPFEPENGPALIAGLVAFVRARYPDPPPHPLLERARDLAAEVPEQGTAAHHAARGRGVGFSEWTQAEIREIRTAKGKPPRTNAVSVKNFITGKAMMAKSRSFYATRFGNAYEDYAFWLFRYRFGERLTGWQEIGSITHPRLPFLRGSLDMLIVLDGEIMVLEIKCLVSRKLKNIHMGPYGPAAETTREHFAQVQGYLDEFGCERGLVAQFQPASSGRSLGLWVTEIRRDRDCFQKHAIYAALAWDSIMRIRRVCCRAYIAYRTRVAEGRFEAAGRVLRLLFSALGMGPPPVEEGTSNQSEGKMLIRNAQEMRSAIANGTVSFSIYANNKGKRSLTLQVKYNDGATIVLGDGNGFSPVPSNGVIVKQYDGFTGHFFFVGPLTGDTLTTFRGVMDELVAGARVFVEKQDIRDGVKKEFLRGLEETEAKAEPMFNVLVEDQSKKDEKKMKPLLTEVYDMRPDVLAVMKATEVRVPVEDILYQKSSATEFVFGVQVRVTGWKVKANELPKGKEDDPCRYESTLVVPDQDIRMNTDAMNVAILGVREKVFVKPDAPTDSWAALARQVQQESEAKRAKVERAE